MGFIKAVNKHAHSAEPHETQKIKVDLHIVEQTLQDTYNHLEGLHQKQFVVLVV